MGVKLVNPEGLAPPVGYAHAAIGSGRPVVLAGQIGCDASGKVTAPGDLVAQFSLALDNLLAALRACGGEATDLAQMRIFVTDVQAYRDNLAALGHSYRERLGRHYPAMALLGIDELFEKDAMIEIEGLAYVD